MKGKKILSLVSLAMGVAIVGATFAAWAVTDNADPFGIKISPSDIEDDHTNFVTLEYGERTFADVANLVIGKARLGATVGLKATTSNNNPYKGHFDISLINQTSKASGADLLIDYLNVDVYTGTVVVGEGGVVTDISGATLVGHVPTTGEDKYKATCEITVNSAEVKTVYVVVSISEDASPILDDIKSDVVFLQMDWNSNGTDEVKASKVYFQRDSAVGSVYCYAWGNGKQNGAFPGQAMTSEGSGIYSYDLSTDYEKIIFSDVTGTGDSKVVNFQTDDLTIDSTMRAQTPFYAVKDGGGYEWKAAPIIEALTKDYYLVGDKKNAWKPTDKQGTNQGFTKVEEGSYILNNVQLVKDEQLKVCSKDLAHWYGRAQGDEYLDVIEGGNLVVKASGAYDVHFVTASADNNFVWITPVVAA